MEVVRDFGEPSASKGHLARARRASCAGGRFCARLRRPSRELDASHSIAPTRAGRMSRWRFHGDAGGGYHRRRRSAERHGFGGLQSAAQPVAVRSGSANGARTSGLNNHRGVMARDPGRTRGCLRCCVEADSRPRPYSESTSRRNRLAGKPAWIPPREPNALVDRLYSIEIPPQRRPMVAAARVGTMVSRDMRSVRGGTAGRFASTSREERLRRAHDRPSEPIARRSRAREPFDAGGSPVSRTASIF